MLNYYDTSLLLKGSLVLGKDLEVRLVDSKEVEGRPNAFEVFSGTERYATVYIFMFDRV